MTEAKTLGKDLKIQVLLFTELIDAVLKDLKALCTVCSSIGLLSYDCKNLFIAMDG